MGLFIDRMLIATLMSGLVFANLAGVWFLGRDGEFVLQVYLLATGNPMHETGA